MSNQFIRNYNINTVEKAQFEVLKPSRLLPTVTVKNVENLACDILNLAVSATYLTGLVTVKLAQTVLKIAVNALIKDAAKPANPGAQRKELNNNRVTTTVTTTTTTTTTHYYDL
jgi:hypothetical protein